VQFQLGDENNQWRKYFEDTITKIHDLQHQIETTDNDIDKMVYQLYELTPEEIEIVENTKQ